MMGVYLPLLSQNGGGWKAFPEFGGQWWLSLLSDDGNCLIVCYRRLLCCPISSNEFCISVRTDRIWKAIYKNMNLRMWSSVNSAHYIWLTLDIHSTKMVSYYLLCKVAVSVAICYYTELLKYIILLLNRIFVRRWMVWPTVNLPRWACLECIFWEDVGLILLCLLNLVWFFIN